MSEDKSYPHEVQKHVCASCNADTDADGKPIILRCGTCKQVYYCNRNCQKEDWKNEHKAVCKPKCGICSLEFPKINNLVPMPISIDGGRKIFDACASCVKQMVDKAEIEKEGKMPCELCDEMITIADFTTPSIYKRDGISYHIRACVTCIQKQQELAQTNQDTEEYRELLKCVENSINSSQELFKMAQTKRSELVKEKENKKKKKKKKNLKV